MASHGARAPLAIVIVLPPKAGERRAGIVANTKRTIEEYPATDRPQPAVELSILVVRERLVISACSSKAVQSKKGVMTVIDDAAFGASPMGSSASTNRRVGNHGNGRLYAMRANSVHRHNYRVHIHTVVRFHEQPYKADRIVRVRVTAHEQFCTMPEGAHRQIDRGTLNAMRIMKQLEIRLPCHQAANDAWRTISASTVYDDELDQAVRRQVIRELL